MSNIYHSISEKLEGLKEDIVLSENTGVNNFRFKLKTNGTGGGIQFELGILLSDECFINGRLLS